MTDDRMGDKCDEKTCEERSKPAVGRPASDHRQDQVCCNRSGARYENCHSQVLQLHSRVASGIPPALKEDRCCRCECRDEEDGEGRVEWSRRSEERRVGKECRSRWSPY